MRAAGRVSSVEAVTQQLRRVVRENLVRTEKAKRYSSGGRQDQFTVTGSVLKINHCGNRLRHASVNSKILPDTRKEAYWLALAIAEGCGRVALEQE